LLSLSISRKRCFVVNILALDGATAKEGSKATLIETQNLLTAKKHEALSIGSRNTVAACARLRLLDVPLLYGAVAAVLALYPLEPAQARAQV
jgi:hypothetical protein